MEDGLREAETGGLEPRGRGGAARGRAGQSAGLSPNGLPRPSHFQISDPFRWFRIERISKKKCRN